MEIFGITALLHFIYILVILACLLVILILSFVIIALNLHIKGLYKKLEEKRDDLTQTQNWKTKQIKNCQAKQEYH